VTSGLSRRELRRQLGPVAWCALEDITEDAQVDALGRRVAITSVRRLAAQLGVSKDTAARALLRLRHAGLVEPLTPTRGGTGRFGHATYLVRTFAADVPAQTVRSAASARQASQQQPSLFDEAVAEAVEEATAPEKRKAEKAETRRTATRTPEARSRDAGDAIGREANDGKAAHTLAPCGAVGSPAGADDFPGPGVIVRVE